MVIMSEPNISGYRPPSPNPGAPSAGPGEARPIDTSPSLTTDRADASPNTPVGSQLTSIKNFFTAVTQQINLPSLSGAVSIIKTGVSNAASSASTVANKVTEFVKDKFTQATSVTDESKFKENILNYFQDKISEAKKYNNKSDESKFISLKTTVSNAQSKGEIESLLDVMDVKLPSTVRAQSQITLSDRFDSAKSTMQELKAKGQERFSQILNAEKQAKSEALLNESLAGINIELENPNTPEDVKQQLNLAKAVIKSAKNDDGSINTDTVKGVLKQLNEGRAENDKIGQRFLVEDTPKPNKLSQTANHVVDLAKSKINEIKNREANKNAETMRNEVLGEIDERIKSGNSSREIEVARAVIVNAKNETGINANFIKHTLQELNQGLTDKIGERFLFESTTASSQNIAEKALGFLKDGIKFLTEKAVSLKERIAPKTTLENVDKKATDAALVSIKTVGRSRAQVISGASGEKVKELQNLKNELLAFQDQNFYQDLRDAADSVSPLDDSGKPLSKEAYKNAILSELNKVQEREEELREESLSIVQDFYNTFSDVEKRGPAFEAIDAKIRDAHYKEGRLLSVEELHQNLDEILNSAPRGSRQEAAEKAHENRLNNLVKRYADQAPSDDVRAAMKQVNIRDSYGNFLADKELEQQLKNYLDLLNGST